MRPPRGHPFVDSDHLQGLDGRHLWRRLRVEAVGQTKVPQQQPHNRRQLLTRQVVAHDPIQAQLPIFLGKSVLLTVPPEVGRHGLGGGPGVGGQINGEEFDLPAIDHPAALCFSLSGVDGGHHTQRDGLVG